MDKNTKQSKVNQVKAEIIVHCMDFMHTKNDEDRKAALLKLNDYAKFYRISLRRKAGQYILRNCLKSFILNKTGYIETMSPLYNCLMTEKGKKE